MPMTSDRRRGSHVQAVEGSCRTRSRTRAALFGSLDEEDRENQSPADEKPKERPETKDVLRQIRTTKDKKDFRMIPSDSEEEYERNEDEDHVIDSTHEIVHGGSVKMTHEAEMLFNKVHGSAIEELRATDAEWKEGGAASRRNKTERIHVGLNKMIRFGRMQVETWYTAPYPQEYARLPVLHICEFCLNYFKTEATLCQHLTKCDRRHPPGNEIYRHDGLSVFEVDGNTSKTYCQDLCLLARLFLNHKSLFYDVEPFIFYVLTKNDGSGCHFIGYFSKEKYGTEKFNVSCIVTLPCFQKRGYGRFLIDFSFLLSRLERNPGTPELPFSDLGRVAYASYWRSAILEWVKNNMSRREKNKKMSLNEIACGTGIAASDVCEMLDVLGWLKKTAGASGACVFELDIDWDMVDEHWQRCRSDSRRIWIDEECIRWSPVVYTPTKDGWKSPTNASGTSRTPKTTPKSSLAASEAAVQSGGQDGEQTKRKKGKARRRLDGCKDAMKEQSSNRRSGDDDDEEFESGTRKKRSDGREPRNQVKSGRSTNENQASGDSSKAFNSKRCATTCESMSTSRIASYFTDVESSEEGEEVDTSFGHSSARRRQNGRPSVAPPSEAGIHQRFLVEPQKSDADDVEDDIPVFGGIDQRLGSQTGDVRVAVGRMESGSPGSRSVFDDGDEDEDEHAKCKKRGSTKGEVMNSSQADVEVDDDMTSHQQLNASKTGKQHQQILKVVDVRVPLGVQYMTQSGLQWSYPTAHLDAAALQATHC